MKNDVVIVFEAPAADLSVGEEFQRARLSLKLKRAAESRALEANTLTLVKREKAEREKPRPPFQRAWPKGCNTCAGLAHRVEEENCPECGTARKESA